MLIAHKAQNGPYAKEEKRRGDSSFEEAQPTGELLQLATNVGCFASVHEIKNIGS